MAQDSMDQDSVADGSSGDGRVQPTDGGRAPEAGPDPDETPVITPIITPINDEITEDPPPEHPYLFSGVGVKSPLEELEEMFRKRIRALQGLEDESVSRRMSRAHEIARNHLLRRLGAGSSARDSETSISETSISETSVSEDPTAEEPRRQCPAEE